MIKKTIIFLFAIAMIVSCDKNDEFAVEQASSPIKVSRSCMDVPYWVEDGTLHFNSTNEVFLLMDSLSKLSYDAFCNWEKNLNFNSYENYINEIADKIYSYEDIDEMSYSRLINEYKGIVSVDSDKIVIPAITTQLYRYIVNKEGVFYVGDIKNQVKGDKCFAYRTDGTPIMAQNSTRANGDIVRNYPQKEYINSDGDRKVITSASLKDVSIQSPQGFVSSGYSVEIVLNAYKKRFPKSSWKLYDTDCIIENFSMWIPGYGNNQITVNPYFSSGRDVKTYTVSIPYYPSLAGLSLGNYIPQCIHFRARTRGTGLYGVGYNFVNGTLIHDPSSFPPPAHLSIDPHHAFIQNFKNE